MMTPRSRGRSGWTLVEVLVVLAIVGLLLALLLPAVQSARESARRVTCQDRLRQVGLALQSHAASTGALPSLYNGGFLPQPVTPLDEFHFHSWRTAILPGIEQSALFAAINFNLPATVAANQTTANVRLAAFICPSTPDPGRPVPDIYPWNGGVPPAATPPAGTAAGSDYEIAGGVQVAPQTRPSFYLDIYEFGAWGEPTYNISTSGTTASYRKASLAAVTDGLSNTLLTVERAGRPDLYRKGKPVERYHLDPPSGIENHSATWAISSHFLWYVCVRTIAIPGLPQDSVNGSNRGVFSFHPGGAHGAMADGSVRFLKETTAPATLKGLVTRAGSEVAAPE